MNNSYRNRAGNKYSVGINDYYLKPGHILLNMQDTIVKTTLGNSVAVVIYDKMNNVGGMAHFIKPATRNRRNATAQYGNVAVGALCRMIRDAGGRSENLVAQIIGGACNCSVRDRGLGRKNIQVAREVLFRFGIPVISEDTGGLLGRKVIYHSGTNELVVYKVDSVREYEWFKPKDNLLYA